LALGGCVAEDGFPSLAQRPAELNRSIEEPVRPAVEVPSDPALRARVATLLQQAAEGERSFAGALATTEAAVGRAGAASSETWVEAQQALSRLESTREATTRALAELDRLALERAEVATGREDYAAINAAIAEVDRIAVSQQQRWERLRGRLAALP
jgi:hypothetical protein